MLLLSWNTSVNNLNVSSTTSASVTKIENTQSSSFIAGIVAQVKKKALKKYKCSGAYKNCSMKSYSGCPNASKKESGDAYATIK